MRFLGKLEPRHWFAAIAFGGFGSYLIYGWWDSMTWAGLGAVVGAILGLIFATLVTLESLAWPIITIRNRAQSKRYRQGDKDSA